MIQSVFATNHTWMDHMGGWGWGMMIFGWFFMLALVAAVAWGIWAATRRRDVVSRRGASEILAERYARGEIGREEYLEGRADLG